MKDVISPAPAAQSCVFSTREGTAPVLDPSPLETKAPRWLVTVFDNDKNTYEEVITILVLATGCTEEEAYIEAWEIDHYGKSVVHVSDENDCRRAAELIRVIGIRVEVAQED